MVISAPTPADLLQRDALLNDHPILLQEYRIATPRLKQTYEIIRQHVWMRRTGIIFHSPPRMGKTRCAYAVRDLLRVDFPSAMVIFVSLQGRQVRPTREHFYRQVLNAIGHAAASRKDAVELLKLLKTDIQLQCLVAKGKQCILLIDEVHLMSPLDFQQLAALHNQLEEIGVRMTTVGFAQPEILHQRSLFMSSEQRQYIARFLAEIHAFGGCQTEGEFGDILKFYYEKSQFPEGSGWSYTRFFIPVAFAEGQRLNHIASKLWPLLVAANGELIKIGVPMEHLCLTIDYTLVALHKLDYADLQIPVALLEEAVKASNLKMFSGLMQPPDSATG